jgi:hypothetical protein
MNMGDFRFRNLETCRRGGSCSQSLVSTRFLRLPKKNLT